MPSVPFEILVATMFRSDFGFLEAMFPEASCWDYDILIINQTDAQRQLKSTHPNVRVINTKERGLSRSRNMALSNAIGDMCLIADDDVRYVKNVEDIVVSAFAKADHASIITFQINKESGGLYKEYPSNTNHDEKSIKKVSSVEIAFDRKKILNSGVRFNEYFGLGATFKTGEEYIFIRDVFEQGGSCLFEHQVVLTHPDISSGQLVASPDVIFGQAALRYKYMGKLAYLSMIKYAWFYYRRGEITFSEIPLKIKVAFTGIRKYRELQRLGSVTSSRHTSSSESSRHSSSSQSGKGRSYR